MYSVLGALSKLLNSRDLRLEDSIGVIVTEVHVVVSVLGFLAFAPLAGKIASEFTSYSYYAQTGSVYTKTPGFGQF